MRKTDRQRLAAGICLDCTGPAEPGRTRCAGHLARNRSYSAGARRSCADCGEPTSGQRCRRCAVNRSRALTDPKPPPRNLVRCACGLVLLDVQGERHRHAKTCAVAHYVVYGGRDT